MGLPLAQEFSIGPGKENLDRIEGKLRGWRGILNQRRWLITQYIDFDLMSGSPDSTCHANGRFEFKALQHKVRTRSVFEQVAGAHDEHYSAEQARCYVYPPSTRLLYERMTTRRKNEEL